MFQCVHCDEQAIMPLFLDQDRDHKLPFCCSGCLTVYEILKEHSLSSYYEIKKSSGIIKRRSPVDLAKSNFSYLDNEQFQKEHCYRTPDENLVMDFYLEGIHCLACLWLIEKLPEFVEGVLRSKLDLDKSIASVSISQIGSFAQVARELNRLGYRPHALKRNEGAKKLQEKEERTYLKRMGVAGAAAGNIMIYSVSLYGGASEGMGKIFSVLTFLISILVFTYSALPFYQSAWTSLKNKTLSIDIPIAMSLIMGFVMGTWGLYHDFSENYFDSLTALVFLLLLSRYFLRKIQDKGLTASDLHYFYQNESVLRQTEAGFEEIHSQYVRVGDILKVRRFDFIPADGVVMSGDSLINNSLLTGESLPDHVKPGHKVFSGTQNVGALLLIRVEETHQDSRLGKILKNVEQGWALKSRTVDITSMIAKYFTLAVIGLAVILFFISFQEKGMAVALTRALTLLIVTCPCALAISVPFTFHRSLSLAANNGIIVKSDEVFEKLIKVKKVFLDKTGTITLGNLQVTDFKSSKDILNVVLSLELYSRHPVAKALVEFAKKRGARSIEVSNYQEIPGKGVEGECLGHFYQITGGEVFEDGKIVASFQVRDGIRRDSREIIERLGKRGLDVLILSGDKKAFVTSLADEAGISHNRTMAEISPEEKVKIVSDKESVMVGDGANDAMALEGAGVGIAVSGAMDIALRASDVYLTTPGLGGVEKLFILSQETMKIVKRNLILSILYNSLSVVFVFSGLINPLIAAIVMPLSSFTVLLSTLWGTKKLRSLWK